MSVIGDESRARSANSADLWNEIWRREGTESWRKEALSQVYARIERLVPEQSDVVDIGGGVGLLAERLIHSRHCGVLVIDSSKEALHQASISGAHTYHADIETTSDYGTPPDSNTVVVATEVVEHLSRDARARLFHYAASCGRALFSVPNDRLGPDEEPQHTIKFTAISLKEELRGHFEHLRIEVLGPYLLAVCGFPKPFTLSMCLPTRDEEDDLEATLASFRGVADEIVVGIDPRTIDSTREIAHKYADVVFELSNPEGPADEKAPENGVNFSWVRNQCMDRCTGDWIFMTEGHERLKTGQEVLLSLDQLHPGVKVGYVLREGTGQQWGFPWLCRNDPRLRYRRITHNELIIPEGYLCVKLPQVRTLHERSKDREEARRGQRKVQNRKTLFEDWLSNQSELSLYYLASEWREFDETRTIAYLEKFLTLPPKNGPLRYQARLVLAKTYMRRGDKDAAWRILQGAAADDWTRVEHWMWLGDLAFNKEQFEEALQYYRYASTAIGEPPFTSWWIDVHTYSYLPALRLAMTYTELGRLIDALFWARRTRELFPDDAPLEMFEEADKNITTLEEAVNAIEAC